MSTIVQLVTNGFKHWNDSEKLTKIGGELESRSRFSEAKLILQRAIELNPTEFPNAYLSLAFSHFRSLSSSAEAGEETLVDGIEQTDSWVLKAWHSAFVEEEDIAQQMMNVIRPVDNMEVQIALAGALLWRGNTEESYTLFSKIAKNYLPTSVLPESFNLFVPGMCWMKGQGRKLNLLDDILPYAEQLVRQEPDNFSHRNALLMVYQTEKDWNSVAIHGKQALVEMPDEETIMLAIGIACEQLSNNNEAIMWYNRAIGAKPSFVRARIRLANCWKKLENIALAEDIMREIPIANPKYVMGKIFLSYFLHDIGKSGEAKTLFSSTYPTLKNWEKGSVEQHETGKQLLQL